ncbi:MAG: class I SAM-dependent methyltransferase [Eubacteriales bacterium]|nr:class I SAM-dependent methyltransferase [Eubacteriales bacterium]
MNATQKEILEHWYAWIYEQQEDEAELTAYLLRELGDKPLKIIEAACGGGKLCVPLAQAGHDVTGLDRDESMLRIAREKAKDLPNLHIRQADLLAAPWGKGFDAVLLGSNLLVNIVTDRDYKRAQKNLLERAYEALRPGGRLLLDFDCPLDLDAWQPAREEWVCFEGTDDRGVYGRYVVIDGTANDRTRVVTGRRRYELFPAQGEPFVHYTESWKTFPTIEEVCGWLYRIGFRVEAVMGGCSGEPFDAEHRRAVIRASKRAL